MMKRLDLDFRSRRGGSPWLGWLLVAIGAAVCLDAGLTYYDLRKSLREGEKVLVSRAPAARGAKASPQEVAAVRETVQRLALPWDELFKALESAANDKVALAAIEPNAAKGTVTISGDGKDYLAALSYVSNLSRSESLDRVELVRHERKNADPNSPVNFAVSAAWTAR